MLGYSHSVPLAPFLFLNSLPCASHFVFLSPCVHVGAFSLQFLFPFVCLLLLVPIIVLFISCSVSCFSFSMSSHDTKYLGSQSVKEFSGDCSNYIKISTLFLEVLLIRYTLKLKQWKISVQHWSNTTKDFSLTAFT